MSEKVRCYRVKMYEGANPLIVEHGKFEDRQIEGDLASLDVGQAMLITVIELTRDELEALPEWDGP